ncbi:MAG TPA: TIR domain-containing protein, partial [Candidatus Binataceae bacterium]|nr:TIR domain-containing protein [Candidatus Binataceae bacterium]
MARRFRFVFPCGFDLRGTRVPHDVFISHSVRDEPYADAVCAKLESRAIRCWIAPRDIRPGMSWGSSIIEAIDGARVMLLVFSSHANGSPQISREVERAVNKGLVVIPVRVEDVKPSGDLEYFLGTPHWLDAITPPFERHVDGIADSAKFWLERLESARASSGTERPPQSVGAEPPVAPAAGPGSIQPDASNAPAPKVTAEAASRSCPKCAREIPAAAMVCPYCRVNLKQAAATPGKRRSWLIAAAGLAVACAAAFAGVYHYETIYLPRHQAEEQRRHTFRDCEGCPEMVVVPSGSFTMGDDTDTPTHHVTIGQSFAAGKYPVTRDQYARFVKATGHSNDEWKKPGIPQTGRDPVVNVNWNDAQA